MTHTEESLMALFYSAADAIHDSLRDDGGVQIAEGLVAKGMIDALRLAIREVLAEPANDPVTLARLFHATYERLAPEYGYETRPDTKDFDPESKNGRLMVRVCAEISNAVFCPTPAVQPLTAQQLDALIERHCGGTEIDDGQYSAMVIFAASVERAHGIGTDRAAPPADDIAWGIDWGRNGDQTAVSIIKKLPDGSIEVVATEYGPPADDEAVRLLTEVAETVPNMSIELEQAINAYLAKVGK